MSIQVTHDWLEQERRRRDHGPPRSEILHEYQLNLGL